MLGIALLVGPATDALAEGAATEARGSALSPGPTESVHLELQVAGGEPLAHSILHSIDRSGTLWTWVHSPTLDVVARIEDGSGAEVAALEIAAAQRTVLLVHPMAEPGELRIRLTAAPTAEPGTVEFRLGLAFESDTNREALASAHGLVEEARSALGGGDYAAARERLRRAMDALKSGLELGASAEVARLSSQLGALAHSSGSHALAAEARRITVAFCERFMPPDHLDLAGARHLLAWSLMLLREMPAARELQRQVVEVRARQLSEDHPDLLWAWTLLAWCLRESGEPQEALELTERILETRSRTLPDDHLDLAWARYGQGASLSRLGRQREARPLLERALEVFVQRLGPQHPEVQWVRRALAWTLLRLGEPQRAREMQELAIEHFSRTAPPDSLERMYMLDSLAVILNAEGRIERARALQEQVLSAFLAQLPEHHPDVLVARGNLAIILQQSGDTAAAVAIREQLVASLTRLQPPDELRLALERMNLAISLRLQKRLERAEMMATAALEYYSRSGLEHSVDGLQALVTAAAVLNDSRRFEQAYELLGGFTALPQEQFTVQDPVRRFALELASMILNNQGRVEEALELKRALLGELLGDPGADPKQITRARASLLWSLMQGDHLEESRAVLETLQAELHDRLESTILHASPREVESQAASWRRIHGVLLSSALGNLGSPALQEDAGPSFDLVEALRAIAVRSSRALRGLPQESERISRLRADAREAAAELVRVSWSEGATGFAYLDAVSSRDRAERTLREALRTQRPPSPRASALLAGRLAEHQAAVAYWNFHLQEFRVRDGKWLRVEQTIAFVARPGAPIVCVRLGPTALIEAAVERWRSALLAPSERGIAVAGDAEQEVSAAGEELRRLVVDPLRDACGAAREWIVALDGPLHLVPLDALPDGEGCLGDRVGIRICTGFGEDPGPFDAPAGTVRLLAVGGLDYEREPRDPEAVLGSEALHLSLGASHRGRATWERGFSPLPGTRDEVRTIAALFEGTFEGSGEVRLLHGRDALRSTVLEGAERAEFLHLATHGYFAPESVPSLADAATPDASGEVGGIPGFEGDVRGLSPMVLCGLALSGANRPPDELGRIEGLLTAEELASLDLGSCRLAVLSACDTNVGVRRAGQGVASFQTALHAAGARAVITSLWKVPDEVTQELMIDFYRRLWVQEKPALQALWEAKQRIRAARDEQGRPLYRVRDWAAWQLSSDPWAS